MRALVVEDHADMAEVVAVGLRRAGMAVDVVYDGEAALERALVNDYDVVVLAGRAQGARGRSVRTPGRGWPTFSLDAHCGWHSRRPGGRARPRRRRHLPKPFAFADWSLVYRPWPAADSRVPPVLRYGDLEVDCARHLAQRGGRQLGLGPKEFGVLELLLGSQGRVLSAEELLEHVWDEHADPFTKTVSMTLSRLRAKLGDPPLIETVPKSGYRLA